MSIEQSPTTTPVIEPPPATPPREPLFRRIKSKFPNPVVPRWAGWLVIILGLGALFHDLGNIGIDLRTDAFAWGAQDQSYARLNAGIARAQSILDSATALATDHPNWSAYRRIMHGMVLTYDRLDEQLAVRNHIPDAPPLGMLMITHCVKLSRPAAPASAIARNLMHFNFICEALSAMLLFALVWIWMERTPADYFPPRVKKWMHWPTNGQPQIAVTTEDDWRMRWGDPLLIAPVILLGICTVLRMIFTFTPAGLDTQPVGPVDARFTSPSFWIFAVLRFLSVICLVRLLPRPFKAPACAFVAAMLVWLNPALILGNHAWPLFDVWAVPMYLLAALLISLNRWTAAGIALALGCLLAGATIWAAPVLLLCPLAAGYPAKFLKIIGGFGATAAIVLWAWLINNHGALAYVVVAMLFAIAICIISIFRPHVQEHLVSLTDEKKDWHWSRQVARFTPAGIGGGLLLAALITLWVRSGNTTGRIWTFLLCLAILGIPFLTPKRLLISWLIFVFAASTWIAAFNLDGDFSWWRVGYAFATTKYQDSSMNTNTVGNIEAVMERQFGWRVGDPLTTLHVPFVKEPVEWTLGQTLVAIDLLAVVACAVAAGIQLRRGDVKFLIALAAPWMLAATLIVPMPASFMILPAIFAAGLVAVSSGLALMELLMIAVGSVMILQPILQAMPQAAPATLGIVRNTAMDLGWLMPLAAAVFLYTAFLPGRVNRSASA